MPLLRRQPFVKVKPPSDLKPDDLVFHCKLTNEIFIDYDQFFERIILCNSLVWTCAVTGRPQLTYQEALESEEKARKHLSTFPKVFQRPMLCLASMTYRSRLGDLNDDIFSFTKDRYFVGEDQVEVFHRNSRKMATVLKVIPPKERPKVPKKPTPKLPPPDDSDSDVKIIEKPVMIDLTLSDSELDDGSKDKKTVPAIPPQSSPKGTPKSTPRATPSSSFSSSSPGMFPRNKTIDPDRYSYLVKIHGDKKDPVTIKACHISRKKGTFTRDKCKLFLKQHCEAGDGIWRVKPKYVRSLAIDDDTWNDIFAGPRPAFGRAELKKKGGKMVDSAKFFRSKKEEKKQKEKEKEAKKKLEEEAKAAKRIENLEKEQAKAKLTSEERAVIAEKIKQEKLELKLRMKEERMKMMEEVRAKKKEERDKEREKQKEERRIQAEFYKEWSRIRDDMECDDLRPLPEPVPVGTQIPQEVFGDVLLLLEFLHHFELLFDITETFQNGIDIELIEKALLDNETNGTWYDLLKLLLTSIFSLQEEEEEEESERERNNHGGLPGDLPAAEGIDEDMSDVSTQYLIQTATAAAQWPVLYQGTPLPKLSIDSFTITEILRLHFLSSGARASALNAKFRYQQRGGYTSLDDAGLEFRKDQPAIIKTLGNGNVFDLGPRDKMKIVHALLGQALTYAVARDIVEEGYEKAKQLRIDLRSLQASEQKREREEATARWKRRMEERAREKEREAERKAQKLKEREEQLLAAEQQKDDEAAAKPAEKALNPEDVRTSGRLKQKKIGKEEKQIEEILYDYEKLKDLDPANLTEHQKQIVEEKRAELAVKRKEEIQEREQEFLDEIYEIQSSFAVYPIGRDRLYRRYWVFKSIPGLFVEDDEDFISSDCLTPAEQKQVLVSDQGVPMKTSGQENSEKVVSTGSDKENDSFEGKLPNNQDSGKSVLGSDDVNQRTDLVNGDEEAEKMDVDIKLPENRAVEQIVNRSHIHWAFYNTVDDLDRLLNSLNIRGSRESALRQAILEQKDRIINSMQLCPVDIITCHESDQFENPNPKEPLERTFMNIKSRNKFTQGSVKNNTAQEFIELNLRESLLDLEERIFHGSLGAIKVKDRLKWRDAIEEGGYDRQTDDVQFNGRVEHVRMETDDGASVTSSEFEENQVVRDMSQALLQLARGVEPKYLGPPLGEADTKKKGKTKAALKAQAKKKEEKEEGEKDDISDDGKGAKTPMERWEESLATVTGLSQIFVHLSTLESSVTWGKSALNAQCRICRRKGDADKMLLCDICDRGHHMFCLKPPVKHIPTGNWYCSQCRPKNVARSPRKARRAFVDTESEEEADSSEEEEEEESDDEQDSDEEKADSSDEEADSEDNDDDDEENGDDDDDEEEDDDDSEEDEDVPPAPAKIKLKGRFNKKAEPRRSSGKGTPSASTSSSRKGTPTMEGRNSKKNTPNDRKSGSRLSKGGSQPNSASKTNKRKSQDMNGSVESALKKTKRVSLDVEAKPKAKSSFRNNETFQQINQCEEVVTDLVKHEDSWPFLKPVSKRDAPDYFDIIKKPMDFSTIRAQMNKFIYTEPSQIIEDIRLVFSNCEKYNLPTAKEFKLGQKLSKIFEKKVKDLKLGKPACQTKGKSGKSPQVEAASSRRSSRH